MLKVHYSGLPSHPHYETAKKQMKHFGGMVSFEVTGGKEGGRKVVEVRTPYRFLSFFLSLSEAFFAILGDQNLHVSRVTWRGRIID